MDINGDNKKENEDNFNNIKNFIYKIDFEVALTRFERIWKLITFRIVINLFMGFIHLNMIHYQF